MPPGKDDFDTIPSEAITKERAADLLNTDHGVSIRAVIDYTDAYGGVYETEFCLSRLKSGAINYCKEHESIK